MLHKECSSIDPNVWSRSPSTTNAVEHASQKCQLLYSMPFPMCINLTNPSVLKHLAGLNECSKSYCENSESARRSSAVMRQQQRVASSCNLPTDPTAVHMPPDQVYHCSFRTKE